jgi:hypothetical protein
MSETSFTVPDYISAAKQSVSRVFMDFAQATVHNPDALFAFYEGYDTDYYYPRILKYTTRPIETIKCGNKDKVIRVYKMIVSKPEYNNYHKGFFIDKDFDINTDPEFSDFYVTSCYSIENFFMTNRCMEETLKHIFNFHSGDVMLEQIMDDYCIMRENFLESILLFNTWYCAIRRKYGNMIEEIQLGNQLPKGFLKFDFPNKTVEKLYNMTEILSVFVTASQYPVTQDEMKDAEDYIRLDMLKNLRGKYVMFFLTRYIDHLIKLFRSDAAFKEHKRAIEIHPNNIILILSHFAETDESLVEYIKRVAA